METTEQLLVSKDSVDLDRLDSSTLQKAEVELVKRGQVEVPDKSTDNFASRLEVTGLFKKYGDKNVVNDLSMTFY